MREDLPPSLEAQLGAGVLVLGLALALGLCVHLVRARWLRPRLKPLALTYPDRILMVKEQLQSVGSLLRELEDDLATRTKLLEQRQADADRYEKLASLNKDQAKAVEDLVGRQFKRQGKASAIYWWVGLVLAFVVGLVVNWISGPLWAWLNR